MSAKAIPVPVRFWQYTIKRGPDDCWLWVGARFGANGYGALQVNERALRAHRIAWEMHNGPIPSDRIVCHTCDNPPCVNPAHLYLGTHASNAADKVRRGRVNPSVGGGTRPTKLTPKDIAEIRSAPGRLAEIAAKYGVSRSQISRVKLRQNWRHIKASA